MADYINKIRTTEGDKPVNYEALANKPNSLPNPNKIKFTGSVVAEYDGSSEVTVNIPNGASEEQAAQIQTNTNDISELKNKTSELKGELSNKITKFYASNQGETHLADSDNGKIQDMILYGKSLQDGTPTPENPVEIKSVVNPKLMVRCKNLVQKVIYGYINQSNQLNINNDTTSVIAYLEKEKTYKISCSKTLDRLKIGQLETPDVVHGTPLTNVYEGDTSRNTFIANFTGYACIYIKSVKDTDIINSIQVEEGTVATDYEPYKEQSATLPYTLNAIPVSSDGNVTIDGQQYIADYVDIERKKLVRMVDKHDLGAVDWTMDVYDGNYYFYSVTSGFKSKQGYFDCLCSQYRYVSYHSVKYNDMSLAVQNNNANQYIVLKNDIYTDASSLKSSLNGVYVYFILETPTEIDLTDEEVQAFRDLATYYPTTNVFVTSDQLDGYTEFNYPVSLAEGWNYVKQQLGDTRDYIYDMDLQSAEAYVNSEYAVTLAELEV